MYFVLELTMLVVGERVNGAKCIRVPKLSMFVQESLKNSTPPSAPPANSNEFHPTSVRSVLFVGLPGELEYEVMLDAKAQHLLTCFIESLQSERPPFLSEEIGRNWA